jgi:hypothetical protein
MTAIRKPVRREYATPALTRLGDVEKITRDHVTAGPKDCPFGSTDDIKSPGLCPP